MKVLQLRTEGDTPVVLDLHPQVTLIRRADPALRSRLVDALAGLPAGRADGLGGVIEAQGVRFDLDAGTLALLELASPIDIVVAARDLPGHVGGGEAEAEARRRAEADRDDALRRLAQARAAVATAAGIRDEHARALDELRQGGGSAIAAAATAANVRARLDDELAARTAERERREQEVGAARAARDAVVAARTNAEAQAAAAREARRAALEAATKAAAEVEAARSGVDPRAQAELDQARQQLAVAEAAVADLAARADAAARAASAEPPSRPDPTPAAAPTPEPVAPVIPPAVPMSPEVQQATAGRLAELEARRQELQHLRLAVGGADVTSVQEALAALDGPAPATELGATRAPSPQAAAPSDGGPSATALVLADTWRDLHQQLAALAAAEPDDVRIARERLEAAQHNLATVESDLGNAPVADGGAAAIEAAHALVLDAEERTEGRFGGGRARKKLEDAKAEERRVLEQFGFSTYADFLMTSSQAGVGATGQAIVETARAGVAAAAHAYEGVPGAAEHDARRRELELRRDAIAPNIAALIGHPPAGPEAEQELRALAAQRSPASPADLVPEPVLTAPPSSDRVAALRGALESVGVSFGDTSPGPAELADLARSWIHEQDGVGERRRNLDESLSALEAEVARLQDAVANGASNGSGPALPNLAEPSSAHPGQPSSPDPWAGLPPLPGVDPEPAVAAPPPEPAAPAAPMPPAPDASELMRAHARVDEAHRVLEAAERRAGDASAGQGRLELLEAELARQSAHEQAMAELLERAEAELAQVRVSDALPRAEQALAAAEQALAEARVAEELARTQRAGAADAPAAPDNTRALAKRERQLADATATHDAAAAQVPAAEQAVADAEARLAAAVEAERSAEAEQAPAPEVTDELIDEIEWYLQTRLADQRSIAKAGSVPLVLDDPFRSVAADAAVRLVARLERTAAAVQVIVFSDDPNLAAWAGALGPDRALVVDFASA